MVSELEYDPSWVYMQALTRRILDLAAEVTRAKERVNSPQAQAALPRGASRKIEFAERVSSAPFLHSPGSNLPAMSVAIKVAFCTAGCHGLELSCL